MTNDPNKILSYRTLHQELRNGMTKVAASLTNAQNRKDVSQYDHAEAIRKEQPRVVQLRPLAPASKIFFDVRVTDGFNLCSLVKRVNDLPTNRPTVTSTRKPGGLLEAYIGWSDQKTSENKRRRTDIRHDAGSQCETYRWLVAQDVCLLLADYLTELTHFCRLGFIKTVFDVQRLPDVTVDEFTQSFFSFRSISACLVFFKYVKFVFAHKPPRNFAGKLNARTFGSLTAFDGKIPLKLPQLCLLDVKAPAMYFRDDIFPPALVVNYKCWQDMSPTLAACQHIVYRNTVDRSENSGDRRLEEVSALSNFMSSVIFPNFRYQPSYDVDASTESVVPTSLPPTVLFTVPNVSFERSALAKEMTEDEVEGAVDDFEKVEEEDDHEINETYRNPPLLRDDVITPSLNFLTTVVGPGYQATNQHYTAINVYNTSVGPKTSRCSIFVAVWTPLSDCL